MKKVVPYLVLLVVIAVGLTPAAMASHQEWWRYWYSDPGHTNLVGVHIVDCNHEHWFWGTLSGYPVEETYPCP